MKKVLNIIIVAIMCFCVVSLTGCNKKEESKKLTIISSSFPGYDFARAVVKDVDDAEVKMLLNPGSEMHDYEPTPKDIINIKKSDIFIYVGGESDEWIDEVLDNIDTKKTKVIKLMDLVDVVEEDVIEGMEEEEEEEEGEVEYDEHVWTSPINAIKMVNGIKEEVIKIDKDNKETYETNANEYVNKLTNIDNSIKEIVKNAKRKTLVFGDRFPLRYFVDEYKLSYYAAFPGCSEQTEASAKTISFLIDKVKKENIPVVFHIELSSGKIAKQIADETGAKVLEFGTGHNISAKDFDAGVTFVDIMNNNIKVLKEALN